MANVQEAVRRLSIQATTSGVSEATAQLRQLSSAQDGVAVSSDKTERATLSLEKRFESIERRYVETVRAQQDYEKVQRQVNAAVSQNPALAERANAVLASAAERYKQATGAANDNSLALGRVQGGIKGIVESLASGHSAENSVKGLASSIVGMLGPLGAVAVAYGAVDIAASAFYKLVTSESSQFEKVLKDQERLVGLLKKAYSDADSNAKKFNETVSQGLLLQTEQNLVSLRQQLQALATDFEKSISTPTSVPLDAPLPPGTMGAIENAQVLKKDYQEFRKELDAFFEAVKTGGPQAEKAVADLDNALGRLGRENPALTQRALALVNQMQGLKDLVQKTKEITQAQNPVDKPADRVGANAYELLIQRAKDRNKELEEEAKYAGLASSAVAQLRLQHDAERAAKKAGVEVNQQEIDQIKETLGLRARQLAQANVRASIEFSDRTKFLSPEDLAIAQQLRDVYGNDVKSALSSTYAEQIKVINAQKEMRDGALDFTRDLVRGLMSGQSAMQTLATAATNLSNKLADKALVSLFSGDFIGAAVSGIGALVSGLVGNSAKKKAQQQQDLQAYYQNIAAIDAFIAKANGTSNSLSDALAAATNEMQGFIQQAAKVGDWGKVAQLQAAGVAQAQRIIAEDAKRVQDEITSRSQSYQDRLFAAANDNDTLQGQLAALDRKFAQERIEEQKRGGEALIDLERAQGAERNQVIKRANDEIVKQLQAFAKSIRDFLMGLQTGANSILSPEARLAAAQSDFNSTLALAQGGNQDALGKITTVAQTLLDQAKSFFASSGGYTSIFNQVQSSLAALADTIAPTTDPNAALIAAVQQTTTAVTSTSTQEQDFLSGIETFTNRIVNAVNGLGSLTSSVGSQHSLENMVQINLLAAISRTQAGLAGQTVFSWLGFQNGGVIPGYAGGGVVGNGVFGIDSVMARYAGGGDIALAGGEMVTRAQSVNANTLPTLNYINDNGRVPGMDTDRLFEGMAGIARTIAAGNQQIIARLESLEDAVTGGARATVGAIASESRRPVRPGTRDAA